MEVPAINLKAILLVHWLLTVWGCMAWLPSSYACGNFTVLAVGVWAVAQRDSVDAVLMFLLGMTLTIVTDIVHFGIYYSAYERISGGNTFRFSAGMAILSLILKPLSCFFVYQMYRERGGDYNINFGFPSVTRNRDTYQSIDQQGPPGSSAKPFVHSEDQHPSIRSY
ncbi:type-1 angiotensin II receptor-associated protein isoform X1 [Brachyhypopomus gauderio]|uniref:type-1 angiotensin II receptor-associated protein isoform X1 n=1 Tax=Brachyhypopomus gauderio TaxID=698409 RepID=UPI00404300B9